MGRTGGKRRLRSERGLRMGTSEPISVEQVRVETTWPLRAEVLRPGRTPREVAFPGELDPAAAHFAAFSGDRVVGVASVLPAAEPDGPDPSGVWQLRGMAVAPGQR